MSGHQPVLQSQGKKTAADPQPQQPEPQAQTQFATYWPSYYAAPSGGSGGSGNSEGKPDSTTEAPGGAACEDEPDDEEREQLDREQRVLRRKIANRESAKRSKQKRQQADRDLQDLARTVDDERETLVTQVASAQQRYWDAHAAHFELRRKIQAFATGGPVSNEGDPSGGGAGGAGVGDGGAPSGAAELGGSFGVGSAGGA